MMHPRYILGALPGQDDQVASALNVMDLLVEEELELHTERRLESCQRKLVYTIL